MFWKLFRRKKPTKNSAGKVKGVEACNTPKRNEEKIKSSRENKNNESAEKKSINIEYRRQILDPGQQKPPKEALRSTQTFVKSEEYPNFMCHRCKLIFENTNNKFQCDKGKYICHRCFEAFFAEKFNNQCQTVEPTEVVFDTNKENEELTKNHPESKFKRRVTVCVKSKTFKNVFYKNHKPKKMRTENVCEPDKFHTIIEDKKVSIPTNIEAMSLSKIDIGFIKETKNQQSETCRCFSPFPLETYKEKKIPYNNPYEDRKYVFSRSGGSTETTFIIDSNKTFFKRNVKTKTKSIKNIRDKARQIIQSFNNEYVPNEFVKSCSSWYTYGGATHNSSRSKVVNSSSKDVAGVTEPKKYKKSKKKVKTDMQVCKKSCGNCYLCIKKEGARIKREQRSTTGNLFTAYMSSISCRGKIK